MRTALIFATFLAAACGDKDGSGEVVSSDDTGTSDGDSGDGGTGDGGTDGDDGGGDDTGDDPAPDEDGDGFTADVDCDDADPDVHPLAEETCEDDVDSNCDVHDSDGCLQSYTADEHAAWRIVSTDGGPQSSDGVGRGVLIVEDYDGDGLRDLAIGIPGTDDEGDEDDESDDRDSIGSVAFYPGIAEGRVEETVFESFASIEGADESTYLGYQLQDVGDVDGDGGDDILAVGPGVAWLFVGPTISDGMTTDDATMQFGVLGDGLGSTDDDPAGDLDGDGVPDLLLTNPGYDREDGFSDVGAVYLFTDLMSGGSREAADADVTIIGNRDEDLGQAAAGVGDTDGDGFDDLLLGDQVADEWVGSASVWLGPFTSGTTATSDDGDHTYTGDPDGTFVGSAVGAAGDVNRDGYADFVVGGRGVHGDGSHRGVLFLVHGPPSGGALVDEAAWTMFGAADNSQFGSTGDRITHGDIDGDGGHDLVWGVHNDSRTESLAGAVYAVWGPVTGTHTSDEADVVIEGYASSRFGEALDVDDVDGDGLDDILVGTPTSNSRSGRAYLFLGSEVGVDP